MTDRVSSTDAPDELSDREATDSAESRREVVEIVEALLLAVVTIVAAWAGYSSAKWSTESRLDLASASTLRSEANRALANAEETRNFDATTFDTWFVAYTLNREDLMAVAERRFRPEFRVAFDAWQATNPAKNPAAPPGPTYMPQYRQPELIRAADLDRLADAAGTTGDHAAGVADTYLRVSLVLAAVLFLVGISTTFKIKMVRWVLAGVGGALLVVAVVVIIRLPIP